MRRPVLTLLAALGALFAPLGPLGAETVILQPRMLTDWKPVFGRIETRDRLPARARLGGTLVALSVDEGDTVSAGQELGRIQDQKLEFQLSALAAQKTGLEAQLANAETELARGEELLARGVTTAQRLDALRTQVDVLRGQIAALDAEARVVAQQAAEGAVLAPVAGRVLSVPVAQGAVVQPGEAVALVGGGGTFLRLAVPERHALALRAGDTIVIETPEGPREGRLERVYPLIENGRVIADVTVQGLSDRLIDARVLVRLPVATRPALMVPETALLPRAGLDFVALQGPDGAVLRVVVPGARQEIDGVAMVEILSGLQPGDAVLTDPAPPAEGQGEGQGAGHD